MSEAKEIQQNQVPKFKENDLVYCAAITRTGNMCHLCCGKIIAVYVYEDFINYHILNAKKNLMEVDQKDTYTTKEEALEVAKQFFNSQYSNNA